MKKLLLTLFFACLLMGNAWASYTAEQATVTANVASSGATSVTLTMQVSFTGTETEFTVPLSGGTISDIQVSGYNFQTDTTEDGLTNVVLTEKNGFPSMETFNISYRVMPAADEDDSADTWTLTAISAQWPQPIGAVSFNVSMPSPVESALLVTSGYFGVLNSDKLKLAQTETAISGDVVGGLIAYEALELTLTLPQGYFTTKVSPLAKLHVSALQLILLLVLILMVVYWAIFCRDKRIRTEERLMSPDGILPAQIPMILDGDSCDPAALVLQWANLGYLSIRIRSGKRVVLDKLINMGSERSQAEQNLFNRMFRGKDFVFLVPGDFAQAAEKFRRSMRHETLPVIFDQKGGNVSILRLLAHGAMAAALAWLGYSMMPGNSGWVVLAVLAGVGGAAFSVVAGGQIRRDVAFGVCTVPAVICGLVYAALLVLSVLFGTVLEQLLATAIGAFASLATARGPRKSERGRELYAMVLGRRRFFRRVKWERLQLLQSESPAFFSNQLPEAVALRVERGFARRYETLPVGELTWLTAGKARPKTAQSNLRYVDMVVKELRKAFHAS